MFIVLSLFELKFIYTEAFFLFLFMYVFLEKKHSNIYKAG